MTAHTAERSAALITGAAGQLGFAISYALAERGADLVLADRQGAGLDSAVQRLGDTSGRVVMVEGDLSTDTGAEELVERSIQVLGHLDACINTAGIEGPIGPLDALDLDTIVSLYQINVFGVMRVMKAVIPHFRTRNSGRIINLASGAGLSGTPYMSAYSSSKHAVVGLTRSVAAELGGSNISVNAVCPGCVDSPMMERIQRSLSESLARPVSFASSIPMGRFAYPDEVANLVAYLALDAPPYITGAALVVDGGLRA